MHIRPDSLLFHHKYLPSGPWWDCAAPLLTLARVENVTEVHGRSFPVMKVQHQADIIRMRIMVRGERGRGEGRGGRGGHGWWGGEGKVPGRRGWRGRRFASRRFATAGAAWVLPPGAAHERSAQQL